MDSLFEVGYITNIALIIISFGYSIVGLVVGYLIGADRTEKHASKREARLSEFYRSYYNHPSNQR